MLTLTPFANFRKVFGVVEADLHLFRISIFCAFDVTHSSITESKCGSMNNRALFQVEIMTSEAICMRKSSVISQMNISNFIFLRDYL